MRRGEMEHMLVSRVRQEGTPLLTRRKSAGDEGDIAQFGHDTADVQTPMGVEIIQDPVKSLDLGEPPAT